MRHKMGYKKLNRTSEHRKALIKNMLNSLIKYEQITTTLPKAKVLKPQADKIITLGKKNTLSNTKTLISKLQDIKSTNKVKKTLSKRYENRKGGYTRIIKALIILVYPPFLFSYLLERVFLTLFVDLMSCSFEIKVFVLDNVFFLPSVMILSAWGFRTFAFGKVVVICSYFINELSIFLIRAFLCSEVLLSFL